MPVVSTSATWTESPAFFIAAATYARLSVSSCSYVICLYTHPPQRFADAQTGLAVRAERAFVARLDGGCSSPIAAHAQLDAGVLTLSGLYFDEETRQARRGHAQGAVEDAVALAHDLADRLRAGEGETVS